MNKASSDLINEHKAIILTLGILDKISGLLENDKEVDIIDVKDIIEFLKVFADKCHHGKEEDYLFPALEKAGIRKENGPIGVMLLEHMQGRKYIKEMQDSIADNAVKKEEFITAARGYSFLLRNHIEKENNVLFPMGDLKLSDETQQQLIDEFEKFEENVIGKGKHEEFHAMLHRLKEKYLDDVV